MIESYGLPGLLAGNLGSEKRDFAVMAARSQPLKMSLAVIVFGTFWLAFTSIFVVRLPRSGFCRQGSAFSDQRCAYCRRSR